MARWIRLGAVWVVVLLGLGCAHDITGSAEAEPYPRKGEVLINMREVVVDRRGRVALEGALEGEERERIVARIEPGTKFRVTRVVRDADQQGFFTVYYNAVYAACEAEAYRGREVRVFAGMLSNVTRNRMGLFRLFAENSVFRNETTGESLDCEGKKFVLDPGKLQVFEGLEMERVDRAHGGWERVEVKVDGTVEYRRSWVGKEAYFKGKMEGRLLDQMVWMLEEAERLKGWDGGGKQDVRWKVVWGKETVVEGSASRDVEEVWKALWDWGAVMRKES